MSLRLVPRASLLGALLISVAGLLATQAATAAPQSAAETAVKHKTHGGKAHHHGSPQGPEAPRRGAPRPRPRRRPTCITWPRPRHTRRRPPRRDPGTRRPHGRGKLLRAPAAGLHRPGGGPRHWPTGARGWPVSHPELVEVLRGDTVESFHRGSLAVVDATGSVLKVLGDIDRPVFPRSAVKVLQALPLVASGAADALGLTQEELALACASHGGEPAHAATAAAMLAKAGLDSTALGCGAHWPAFEPAARALAAKRQRAHRAAQQLLGQTRRLRLPGLPDGPRPGPRATRLPARLRAARPPGDARSGRCAAGRHRGGPGPCASGHRRLFHSHLRHPAAGAWPGRSRAWPRAKDFHQAIAQAALRLRRAVAQAPFMVAGTGRFDTVVMSHFGERVFCKVGAEGVYCAALPERGPGAWRSRWTTATPRGALKW